MILIIIELNLLCKRGILARLKQETTFASMFIVTNKLTFPIYISDLKFGNSVGLLQIFDGDKSFTSKVLTDLCFTKKRIKTKNTVARVAYSVLLVKIYWQNIKNFVWALMVHSL